MRKVLLLLTLAAGVAFAQTASYPSAVVTDNQLRVAANNIQTTLTFPMLSSDTTINVVNATGITANSVVTIDNEKIAICNVVGNQLSVGKSSCPNVDGRNFDGTSAAAHANGAGLSLNIDAWHHNAVKAEVEAIEQTLGVNLANVSALIPAVPNPWPVNKGGTGAQSFTNFALLYGQGTAAFGSLGLGTTTQVLHGNAAGLPTWAQVGLATDVAGWPAGSQLGYLRLQPNAGNNTTLQFAPLATADAGDYNFAPITPGGSLTGGGGAQTVTLPVGPLGIVTSGTFASNLYLSGGVGTAESVRPSGGTCTPGATNCTIIISPVNSHSGAWTITSGAVGIDLACASSARGAYVGIAPGDYDIFGSIRPTTGCTFDGRGTTGPTPSGAVNLHERVAAVPLFDLAANSLTVKNVQLTYGASPAFTVGGVAATAGSIGIQSGVTANVDQPVISNVIANNFYINYNFAQGAIFSDHVSSLNPVSHGFVVGALGSGFMLNVYSQGAGGDGYHIKTGSAALQWAHVGGFQNKGWSIYAEDNAAFQMDNLDLENDSLGGASVGVTGVNATMQNVIIQGEGANPLGGNSNTAPGVQVRSAGFLSLSNPQISTSQGNGVELLAGGMNLGGSPFLYQNGLGAQAAHIYNLYSVGSGMFHGILSYLAPVFINGTQNRLVGNYISLATCVGNPAISFGAAATHTVFTGNDIDCQGGGGTSISYTAGSTFADGTNHVSVGTTTTGTPVPDGQTTYTYHTQGTATATAGAATLNLQSGTVTSEALTTAVGSVYTLTLTNSRVSPTSIVLVNGYLGTATVGLCTVQSTPGSGSAVIQVRNQGTGAFNGTIKIDFVVVNPN